MLNVLKTVHILSSNLNARMLSFISYECKKVLFSTSARHISQVIQLFQDIDTYMNHF